MTFINCFFYKTSTSLTILPICELFSTWWFLHKLRIMNFRIKELFWWKLNCWFWWRLWNQLITIRGLMIIWSRYVTKIELNTVLQIHDRLRCGKVTFMTYIWNETHFFQSKLFLQLLFLSVLLLHHFLFFLYFIFFLSHSSYHFSLNPSLLTFHFPQYSINFPWSLTKL